MFVYLPLASHAMSFAIAVCYETRFQMQKSTERVRAPQQPVEKTLVG